MKPLIAAAALSFPLLAPAARAQALPIPVPHATATAPNDELAALQRTLAHHAKEERARRQWVGATGMGVGALMITAGAGLTASNERDASYLGHVVLGGGVGALLAGGLSLSGLLTGGFEDLSEFSVKESSKAGARDVTAARIKHEWDVRAADMESTRLVSGYAALTVGAGLAGVGTYMALSPSARDGELRTLSPALMGVGYLFGVVGAYTIAVPTPLESGREAYEASWPRISAGVAPLPGGGAMSLSGSF